MGHSYSQNLVHCVYSTGERRNLIAPELQKQLWAFMGVIAKREGIPLLMAGGTENHAHLLIALPPTLALAKALQTIKAYSSRWMGEHRGDFKWQEGYGAFSVSPSQMETVSTYIRNQAKHHAKRSFEEELFPALACWAKIFAVPPGLRKFGAVPGRWPRCYSFNVFK